MVWLDYDLNDDRAYLRRASRLHDKDFDEYFRMLDEYTEMRCGIARRLMELARAHGCVVIRQHDGILAGHWFYLSPSFVRDGLRWTHMDKWGPVSHCEIPDERELENHIPEGMFTVGYKVA